ncbi:MAG: hypothetical protein AB7P11_21220 [Hydrogenophaga sp.]|uniref:hypothetical protein n=1 Tax=Hydrogenophaga sp. TaxID=1904254 RepID=UPI003D1040B5
MARGNPAAAEAGHDAGTERRPPMAQQTFPIGTFVVNLTSQPAIVVGEHHGDPVLRSVRANGKPFGGKWVANPALCRVVASAAEAHAVAGVA